MPRILVTGYGPFNEVSDNPSSKILKYLPDKINSYDITKKAIPVDYKYVSSFYKTLPGYDFVFHIGYAKGKTIRIERNAFNSCEGKDINGYIPDFGKVIEEDAYEMKRSSKVKDICLDKCVMSDDAGRYLCNFIYYLALKYQRFGVFIHVPGEDVICIKEMSEIVEKIIKHCIA